MTEPDLPDLPDLPGSQPLVDDPRDPDNPSNPASLSSVMLVGESARDAMSGSAARRSWLVPSIVMIAIPRLRASRSARNDGRPALRVRSSRDDSRRDGMTRQPPA